MTMLLARSKPQDSHSDRDVDGGPAARGLPGDQHDDSEHDERRSRLESPFNALNHAIEEDLEGLDCFAVVDRPLLYAVGMISDFQIDALERI